METESSSDRYSVKVICEIPLKLPSAMASDFKKKVEMEIGAYILTLPIFTKPIKIHFHWIESNKRRDLDNVAFAKKFILDSMVKHGKLADDNRRFVTAFTDTFDYGPDNKVILEIEEVKND